MFATVLSLFLLAAPAVQPAAAPARGRVLDVSGAAVPGATVVLRGSGADQVLTSGDDGFFEIQPGTDTVHVEAPGFAEADRSLASADGTTLYVVLRPAPFADSLVVTPSRGTERLPGATATTIVTSAELANTPAGALDDVLRATPGFSLFRRASSRVANPTTQGVTLRGVSGSGASRTMVLADGVPLNDPFGSWVYWNRVPTAAIDRVEIVRGAAGDLYGADALGGVIQVLTYDATRPRARATVEGGSHGTGRVSAYGGGPVRGWQLAASGEWLATDGVQTIAPEVAGPIDVPAGSDYRTGFLSAGGAGDAWRAAFRVSAYDEDRQNGTPAQVNSTAWRQASGELGGLVGGGAWEARLSGGSQDYYQTFSAVADDRASERLTTEQWTPSEFFSLGGQWSRPLGRHLLLVGAETRRTEATVTQYRSLPTGVRLGPDDFGGTERSSGAFARIALAPSDRLSVVFGTRADVWRSEPLDPSLPTKDVSFVSPRASVAWRAGAVALQGAVYRSHRTPTLNELHRGFRVGNIITNPNPLLEAETLNGVEGGAIWTGARGSARVTGFWNQLDGAIANITLSVTPSLITRERRNSDEIRASGVEFETEMRLTDTLRVNGLLVLTSSHFRGSVASPEIEGNRVPQVPRVQVGGGLTWTDPRFATVAVQVRGTGDQFDDDQNEFTLGGYAVVDAMASRNLGEALQAFVSVENLFDEDYDVARTPLRSIGWPRTVRVGVRVALP
ncbi:MAG: TonB-dependent receptor [Vicinamibacterales bacterium]